MKAVRIHKFGSPDVMQIEEVQRPAPAPDEILVKIYASGINPMDWRIRKGGEVADRLNIKLPLTPGWDAAGVVEEVGRDVTGFKKGDEVYGVPNFPGDGSYAEYTSAKASHFAIKPKSIGFNEASAIAIAGVTAWQGIFECGQLQRRQRILIHGAAGGVGNYALQLAKWKGAYVIGTASANNHEFLKQLGANEVIDYKNQNFEDLLHDIDLIFDAAGINIDTQIKSIQVLKENGILVSTQAVPLSDEVTKALKEKNAKGITYYGELRQEWLTEIARLIDEGSIQVIVSKVYPLEKVADAHRESEAGHVRGKLVLEIRKEA
jgi:NADPH:quinone reductase-like Zn-dependent oxidoreductase